LSDFQQFLPRGGGARRKFATAASREI